MEHPEQIRRMEEASAALGNRRAAAKIVDACLELARARQNGK
jgi:UDP-N-acetylglucosamine:LPS N-acetylglucosamine transferase